MVGMIKVFVDESGNMGASGKYFVLAAVIVKNMKAENRLKRIIRREQVLDASGQEIKKKREEVKFSKMKFSQRQRILNKMSREDLDVYYFVAYKPMVSLMQQGKTKNLIYNYFSKLLMEKIFKRYDDDFEIIFDQRSTTVKSMNSLTDYIKSNAFTLANLVRKQIVVNQADSKTIFLLQAADMVAGATYQSYNNKLDHFFNILKTRVIDFDEFPRGGFPEEN